MLRMAETYFKEDNYEKAYILYHKFVTLFIEKVNFTGSTVVIYNIVDSCSELPWVLVVDWCFFQCKMSHN